MSTLKGPFRSAGLFMSTLCLASNLSFASNPHQIEMTEVDHDRKVDQAALEAQSSAIKKLSKITEKYKNTDSEIQLILRLADFYKESASIEFRIAYGKAQGKNTHAGIALYQTFLKSEIKALDRYIQIGKNDSKIDYGLFLRGKAYEELDDVPHSKLDYLRLVKNYPESSYLDSAYMSLAGFAINANAHLEAISYLNFVIKHPNSKQYPFALYKAAWSHFNLNDIPSAVSNIQKQVEYFHFIQGKNRLSASDQSILEKSLLDSVLFFTEGIQKNIQDYTVLSELKFIGSLEPSTFKGTMYVRLAKLLRSKRMDSDLLQLEQYLSQEEGKLPETLEVVMILFEHEMNQQKFQDATHVLKSVRQHCILTERKLIQSEPYQNARKSLTDAADRTQKQIIGSKNTASTTLPLNTLSAIYQALCEILPEKDPRISKTHSNLGEILFKIKEYEGATQEYLWLLSNWNKSNQLKRSEVQLKAIASRYEVFRNTNLIPKEIHPIPLDSSEGLGEKLDIKALEWVHWIDSLADDSDSLSQENAISLQNFEFEANRMIYLRIGTQTAVNRLSQFAQDNPTSKFAIPSAKLVLDTLIKSSNWEQTVKLTTRLLKIKWTDASFVAQLKMLAIDSSYQMAEASFKAGKFSEAISQAKALQKRFPDNVRSQNAKLLTAQSYLAVQDKASAQIYFSELIQGKSSSGKVDESLIETALLNRAELSNEAYDFKQAILDYEAYLKLHQKNPDSKIIQSIYAKLYFLKWTEGQVNFNCTQNEELQAQCEKYKSLTLLQQDPDKFSITEKEKDRYSSLEKNGFKENRAYWAAVLLKFDKTLDLNNQLSFLRTLSKGWSHLDPLVEIATLPILVSIIPDALSQARANLSVEVPLKKASPQAINRRAEWIKVFENTVTSVLEIPWNRIRAIGLHEIALVYENFATTLKSFPVPKEIAPADEKKYKAEVDELIHPFIEKANVLEKKAFELASESTIEADNFNLIKKSVDPLFKEKTLTLKKQYPQVSITNLPTPIALTLLDLVNPSFLKENKNSTVSPSSALNSKKDSDRHLCSLWIQAFESKSWPKIAFFTQELKEKSILKTIEIKTLQALVLIASGSQAEGLAELQRIKSDFPEGSSEKLNLILISHFAYSRSLEKLSEFSKTLTQIETLPDKRKREVKP